MDIAQRDRDLVTGCAIKPSTTRTEQTPVGPVSDAADIPRKVRVLGEDLVLLRNRHGRARLLIARCCHRGAEAGADRPTLP